MHEILFSSKNSRVNSFKAEKFFDWATSLSVPFGITSFTFLPLAFFSEVARYVTVASGVLYIGGIALEATAIIHNSIKLEFERL